MMKTRGSRALDLVRSIYDGDPWHGSSIVGLLEDVSASDAAAHPIPGAHSIWDLVRHMTAWTDEVSARLSGRHAKDPDQGDWPEAGRAADPGWQTAVEALAASQRALADVVPTVPDTRWDAPVGDTRDASIATHSTHLETLEGLAAHHAYHAGQIALLKRWLESRRRPS
jgi:uncharacterized damage-inducible protein DinB